MLILEADTLGSWDLQYTRWRSRKRGYHTLEAQRRRCEERCERERKREVNGIQRVVERCVGAKTRRKRQCTLARLADRGCFNREISVKNHDCLCGGQADGASRLLRRRVASDTRGKRHYSRRLWSVVGPGHFAERMVLPPNRPVSLLCGTGFGVKNSTVRRSLIDNSFVRLVGVVFVIIAGLRIFWIRAIIVLQVRVRPSNALRKGTDGFSFRIGRRVWVAARHKVRKRAWNVRITLVKVVGFVRRFVCYAILQTKCLRED